MNMSKTIHIATACLSLSVAGAVHATIFSPSGSNAPAVLFDANGYNAGTGVMPNLGTLGSSANTFNPTASVDPVWGNVTGIPSTTAGQFGTGLGAVTFTTAGQNSGESLGYNADGLPTGASAAMTYFVVADDFNTGPGLGSAPWRHSFFGYGEGQTDNDGDGAVFWSRPDVGGALEISVDTSGGPGVSLAPPNDEVVVVAVSIDVASNTGTFTMRTSGGLTTLSEEDPPDCCAWDVSAVHGYLNGNGDGGNLAYMADWKLGAAAIIPANLNDTDREAIVNALYGRYALGSGEALIPEPSTALLLGIGLAGLLSSARKRRS
jgi:hypothetical protein